MAELLQVSVERVVPAPPREVFALLADPRRHREIDGSGTLQDTVDGPPRLYRGARFAMRMRLGGPYEMTNTVVEFEEDRRIAWQPRPSNAVAALVVGGRVWRYELEPVEGGTRVRETWDIRRERFPLPLLAARGAVRRAMERTLERLEERLTAGPLAHEGPGMDLMPGVRARTVDTDRLRLHVYEAGPDDGVPVVLLHGNLSTGRFYERTMSGAPDRYRLLAPDMRGFGRSERVPIDATRGLRDWADDVHAMLVALGVEQPPHLLGWSTGGAAIAAYAQDHPVASLVLVDPVSPYGFGGVRDDGTPCAPDFAGSGGGTANAAYVTALEAGDRSADSPVSPRTVLRTAYWAPDRTVDPAFEDVLVDEVLLTWTGDDGYPGDAVPSPSWPGTGPGTRGILNALSPKHCDWTGIVDLDPKPPVLWLRGDRDIVVADGSLFELGTLGMAGHVPGWPGADAYPPQAMVRQTAQVLDRYRDAGGQVEAEVLEGSGHGPFLDAPEDFAARLFGFLDRR